jgi:D-alanyl-lipoteichoic acid acyltransferase DltB (MBOAT superfamily)
MGVSQLLGLTLPDNFNRPYSSTSLRDFWNRWHITFSHWLRDYVYFSLPKAARWKGAIFCYPIIVMLLGGLWHGIGWTFIVWGLLHGIGLVGLSLYQTFRGRRKSTPAWRKWAGTFFTFQFVCLTWVFFRAPDIATAMAVLMRIGSGTFSVTNITWTMAGVMAAGVAAHSIPPKWFDRTVAIFGEANFILQGAVLASAVLLIEVLSGRGSTSFVYSNF